MKIVGFGDFLIHFSPMGDERFMQADCMKMSFTGAEANVCAALGLWGEKVEFVTRLPEHQLAQKGIAFFRGLNVNMDHVARGGSRMGVYFLEKGASVRSANVIYDRSPSAITEAVYEDFEWDEILKDADCIYLTGITPALSPNLLDCCKKLLQEASRRRIGVFYDVNYRPALSSTEEAGNVLKELAPYITCLIGNEEHLKMLLGISSDYTEYQTKERLMDLVKQTRTMLKIPKIAMTVRRTISASDAIIYAAFSKGEDFAVSRQYGVHVVDRVGSGDAFGAGLVYALRHGYNTEEAVEFAAASNAMKHTIVNDNNLASVEEIKAFMSKKWQDVRR